MTRIIFLVLAISMAFSCKKEDAEPIQPIAESKLINLNGTQQFVMIRGENIKNPVLLHLHGGPGVSEIGGMSKYNRSLEKDFTVVYWDQRNAGKSYVVNFPAAEIKVDKFIEDVDALAKYLKDRLKVRKMLLVGHSWGSRLGAYAAEKYPEHFLAFVSTGQEVAAAEGELMSYRYTLQKAQEFGIDTMVQQLKAIGEPQSGDYRTMYPFPEAFSVQKYFLLELNRRIYDGFTVEDLYANFLTSNEYTDAEKANYLTAAEFTNAQIVNDPVYNNFDLHKEVPELKVPVFFLLGRHDYINPAPLAEKYYQQLKAPQKSLVWFEQSGHDPAWEEAGKYHAELLKIYQKVK